MVSIECRSSAGIWYEHVMCIIWGSCGIYPLVTTHYLLRSFLKSTPLSELYSCSARVFFNYTIGNSLAFYALYNLDNGVCYKRKYMECNARAIASCSLHSTDLHQL